MKNIKGCIVALSALAPLVFAAGAFGQVVPIQSSVTSTATVNISGFDLSDTQIIVDDQQATNDSLTAHAHASMDNAHGVFASDAVGTLVFTGSDSGTFDSGLTFVGVEALNPPNAGGFGHTPRCDFEYEFEFMGDGTLQISGIMMNTSTVFEGIVNITIGSYSNSGDFQGNFFNGQVADVNNKGTVPFNFIANLTASSGHYVLRVHHTNGGLGQRNEPEVTSIFNSNFTISAPAACPADLTGDGMLNFFDVSAFLTAFGDGDLAADFNGDGVLNFFDVSAFLSAFGAGCP